MLLESLKGATKSGRLPHPDWNIPVPSVRQCNVTVALTFLESVIFIY